MHSMGMGRLNATKLGDHLNMSKWHDQVVSPLVLSDSTLPLVSKPGIRWDLLAADILGNNLESRVFGWQDPRSVQALDYWHDFDQNIRFILVSTSAEQALIDAMAISNGVFQSEPILRKWRQQHETMLRFYYRHEHCCVLIDAKHYLTNVKEFKLHLESKFNLALMDLTNAQNENLNPPSIQRFLTTQILKNYPAVISLQSEIEQSLLRLESLDGSLDLDVEEASIDSLIADYCLERL